MSKFDMRQLISRIKKLEEENNNLKKRLESLKEISSVLINSQTEEATKAEKELEKRIAKKLEEFLEALG